MDPADPIVDAIQFDEVQFAVGDQRREDLTRRVGWELKVDRRSG
jgi:hypothetical protein